MSFFGQCTLAVILILKLAAPLRADDQPEVNAVIDKAIAALGGREKLAKFHAATWKGKAAFQAGGQDISLVHEGTAQGSDRYRIEMDLTVGGNTNKVVVVVNGDKAWARGNNEEATELPKEIAGFVKDGMYGLRIVHMLPLFKDKAYTLTHLGELKAGERTAVGLKVTHKDRRDVNLFFDKDSGLPLKSETNMTTPDNMEVSVSYHYSDFKDFAGVKHFTKITFKLNDQEYSTDLSEVKAEEKVDDGTFNKPS